MAPRFLALLDAESDADKESLAVCGLCFLQKRVEPAGHAFHNVHEKPLLEGKRKGKKQQEKADVSDDEDDSKWRKKHKGKEEGGGKKKPSGALKLCPELEGVDLYATLEVAEGATEEQIKKQYRAMALKHHPDKVKAEVGDVDKDAKGLSDADLHFVRIQGAYEVLSDQTKRRQYDSTLDFDDDIPEEVDESVGFYATFIPVFQRNSRFSTRRPIPDLGDDNTDLAKVHKFYDWWFSFESWRDFTVKDEFNLEDADSREERRWMERQNASGRKKLEKEERKRIFHLVEVAERCDPRIRAEREEQEAKKREEKERRARIKQDEEDAKTRAIEEKRLQAEREEAEREEKERLEKEQRKAGKQVLKTLRQRLKKSLQGRGKCDFSEAEMEEVQDWALGFEEAEPLEALCARLEGLPSAAKVAAAVRKELVEWRRTTAAEKEKEEKQREEAARAAEQKAREAKEAAAAAATGAVWSTEELGMLAKGLQKFPGGLGGRWAIIAQFLSTSGYTRTEQEVVAKTKELSAGSSLSSMGARLDMSFQAPKAKAKAEPKAEPKAATAPKAAPKAQAAAPEAEKLAEPEWSSDQQAALEKALQKHPASMDKNERWRCIADDVAGKTKAQCVERFKFLREQIKKKG